MTKNGTNVICLSSKYFATSLCKPRGVSHVRQPQVAYRHTATPAQYIYHRALGLLPDNIWALGSRNKAKNDVPLCHFCIWPAAVECLTRQSPWTDFALPYGSTALILVSVWRVKGTQGHNATGSWSTPKLTQRSMYTLPPLSLRRLAVKVRWPFSRRDIIKIPS